MLHKRSVVLSSDSLNVQDANMIDGSEEEIIEEYKTLNEKCDQVIIKIKDRKAKKKSKN